MNLADNVQQNFERACKEKDRFYLTKHYPWDHVEKTTANKATSFYVTFSARDGDHVAAEFHNEKSAQTLIDQLNELRSVEACKRLIEVFEKRK